MPTMQQKIQQIKEKYLEAQTWKCPLCDLDLHTVLTCNICLDHNHTTGRVRGVLCRNCNAMEGKISGAIRRARRNLDTYGFINRLIRYWERDILSVAEIHPAFKTPEQKKALYKKRRKRKCKKIISRRSSRGKKGK